MAEQKPNSNESAKNANNYETPAIEEVVNRDDIEREVAYAGVPGPSTVVN